MNMEETKQRKLDQVRQLITQAETLSGVAARIIAHPSTLLTEINQLDPAHRLSIAEGVADGIGGAGKRLELQAKRIALELFQ